MSPSFSSAAEPTKKELSNPWGKRKRQVPLSVCIAGSIATHTAEQMSVTVWWSSRVTPTALLPLLHTEFLHWFIGEISLLCRTGDSQRETSIAGATGAQPDFCRAVRQHSTVVSCLGLYHGGHGCLCYWMYCTTRFLCRKAILATVKACLLAWPCYWPWSRKVP